MKKIHYLLISSLLLIIILIIIYYGVIKKEEMGLELQLKGKQIIEINLGDKYIEEGFTAKDPIDGNLTKNVKINEEVNYNKPGTYQITYEVQNSNGIKARAMRYIKINPKRELIYKESYDRIDNTKNSWWPGNKKDHKRPTSGAGATSENLLKYNAYYMGPDDKTIYLTFDEGSLDTYVKEIVDVLDENNVKATFFLCHGFIEANEKLIKKIADNGHSVGNHTANHLEMPSLANSTNFNKYLREITTVEKAYYRITNKPMDKIYREPRGDWSYRSLQIIKDLGYSTYFWSASYLDFNGELSKEKAFKEMESRHHNGAIYLIHPNNKGNYLALDNFIKEMKKQGYKFDLVKNIPTKKQ